MNLKKLFVCGFISGLLTVSTAYAAQTTPFYNIEVVNGSDYDYKYGPYGVSLSEGDNPKVASILMKNNMFSYFGMAPHEYDFGQRLRKANDCIFANDICDAYWAGVNSSMGQNWYSDIINNVKQLRSLVNNNAVSIFDEEEMIYTQISDDGVSGVGYKFSSDYLGQISRREVFGVAKFNNKTFLLKSPMSGTFRDENIGGYATALTYINLEDGKILVGGYASAERTYDDWFEECYWPYYELDYGVYYPYCPAFKTQASLWIIDPENMQDGQEIIASMPEEYLNISWYEDSLSTAAVRKLFKFNDKIIALGYSVTDDWRVYYAPANVATYWEVQLNNESAQLINIKEFSNLEQPGNGDDVNNYTYAVDANDKGIAIVNRKMHSSVNSNKPLLFGISSFTEDLKTTDIYFPLEDKPIRGANSVAEDINNNNFIVGWRDARGEISPVNYNNSRVSEAFLYDIDNKNTIFVNDAICHYQDDNSVDCSQNGKYYYIEWATQINDKQIILANGYEYDTYADWINRKNARIVTLKLVPSEESFVKDEATGKLVINTSADSKSPLVTYNRDEHSPEAVDDNRGGSIGTLFLFSLCCLSICLRYSRNKKID